VQEVYPSPSRETRHSIDIAASAASAAAVASNKIIGPTATRPPPRATRGGAGTMCKPRQLLTIDEKLKMIEMKESGAYRTWADIKEAFPKSVSESAIQDAWSRREILRKRYRKEPGTTRRLRRSTSFSDVDLELRRWCNICAGLGAKSVPLTMAVLRQRAEEIAANLGVTGFSASAGFVRRWAKRHTLVNISLWGTGGSAAADVEALRQQMEEICSQLEAFNPEQIYNMDETGLYFRCLPNRAYVSAGSRRRARGSKAVKNKDRVTLVLAVNATGSLKIPVAIIGKAAVHLCLKSPRAPCPLPYFSQPSAWMDGDVYQKRLNTVFLPAVRARTKLPRVLVVDNCGAHGTHKSLYALFHLTSRPCISLSMLALFPH